MARNPYRRKRNNPRRQRSAQKKAQLSRPRKATVKSLSPILETKKFCGWLQGVVPGPQTKYLSVGATASVHINPAFMWAQGETLLGPGLPLPSSTIAGNDAFSKFLQTKISVEYPALNFMPTNTQIRPIEVIWGWVHPMNLTGLTIPSRTTPSRAQILAHVVNAVSEDFDSPADEMVFNDRKKRNYTVIGRRKLLPRNNRQIIAQAVSNVTYGGTEIVRANLNWKTMKKVEYVPSNDTGIGGLGDPFIYPNQAYIPFYVLYNPDASRYVDSSDDRNKVKVVTNSCHWFNDA